MQAGLTGILRRRVMVAMPETTKASYKERYDPCCVSVSDGNSVTFGPLRAEKVSGRHTQILARGGSNVPAK